MSPSAETIVVHHGAFGGMPAMTMTFAAPPGTVVHPGDRIEADVDRSRDLWTLSRVRVGAARTAARVAAPRFVTTGERAPAAMFVDQRGRRFALGDLAGRRAR